MTLPLTLISGYLGAGKTTLVNHLLRSADGLRLAVLVNEFGDLPIDADLIEADDGDMISIAGGCVCCSFGDDLTQALMDLAKLDPRPDHVLLETSGVALPGAISASLLFVDGYSHDGTLVLVNAETIRGQANDTYIGDTINRQLGDADLVVLNKTDLVDQAALSEIQDWVARSYPDAVVVPAQHGKLPPEILLQSFLARATPDKTTHHPDIFKTVALKVDYAVDAEILAEKLASVELGLARAKGFVVDGSGDLKTVQVVGRRWSLEPAPDGAKPGLVAIGETSKLNADQIETAIADSMR